MDWEFIEIFKLENITGENGVRSGEVFGSNQILINQFPAQISKLWR